MKDVTIKANDLTKTWGTSTPLIAQLLDDGTPLAGRSMVIDIHGSSYPRSTDSNGRISLNINLLAGTYPTTIRFLGDATYNPSSKQVLVRVVNTTVPQKDTNIEYFEVNKIPLFVLTNTGFNVKPGQNIKETQLLPDDNMNSPTFYFNSGFDGDEFEISVVLRESDYYQSQQVMTYLNGWNKMNTVVSVVTDSMIVANGKYTMQIKDKKQTNKINSIWKLRFKQYYENSLSFENLYNEKTASLSSLDLLLLKQKNGINENSPKDVILALQEKLRYFGYLINSGVYDWTTLNYIYYFQYTRMHDNTKQGRCDYETITALVNYSNGGL